MAMNGRDFLAVAERLVTASTEADWRSATSRAYYASFHVTRHLFFDLGFAVPRADRAHQYLVLRLSNCGETAGEQAGRDFDTLRRLRNRADYDEEPGLPQAQAVASVRLAKDLVRVLDSVRRGPRDEITETIKAYERDVLQDVTWNA
jgi:hypothetical protein